MKKNKNNNAVETDKVLTDADLFDSSEQDVMKEHEQNNELETAIQKQNEYLAIAQQIQADFENYKKRTQDLSINARKDGLCFAVEKLLPVLDSISSAKRQVADENFLH